MFRIPKRLRPPVIAMIDIMIVNDRNGGLIYVSIIYELDTRTQELAPPRRSDRPSRKETHKFAVRDDLQKGRRPSRRTQARQLLLLTRLIDVDG